MNCLHDSRDIEDLIDIPAITGKTDDIRLALGEIINDLLYVQRFVIEVDDLYIGVLPNKRSFSAYAFRYPNAREKWFAQFSERRATFCLCIECLHVLKVPIDSDRRKFRITELLYIRGFNAGA